MEIRGDAVSNESFELILAYHKTHNFPKLGENLDTLSEVLITGDYFIDMNIRRDAAIYLIDSKTFANYEKYYEFSLDHGLSEVTTAIEEFLNRNFEKFVASEHFVRASLRTLRLVAGSKKLRVYDEFTVLKALTTWMEFEPEGRSKHAQELFSLLNFNFLTPSAFRPKPVLPASLQQVYNWLYANYQNKYGRLGTDMTELDEMPRLYHDGIFLVGHKFIELVWPEHFLIRKSATYNLPFSAECVTVGGKIYVVGGLARESIFTEVHKSADLICFDPETNEWSRKQPMHLERSNHTACRHADGKLYVFGCGHDEDVHTCEVYDPQSDQWEMLPDMPSCECRHSVTFGKKILLIGDVHKELGMYPEVYDPQANMWLPLDLPEIPDGEYFASIEHRGDTFLFYHTEDYEWKVIVYRARTNRYSTFSIRPAYSDSFPYVFVREECLVIARRDISEVDDGEETNYYYTLDSLAVVPLDELFRHCDEPHFNLQQISKTVPCYDHYDFFAVVTML